MSFFDPVYQNDSIPMNDDESDSDLSVNGLSQGMFHNKNKDQSSQVLDDIQVRNSSTRNENNGILDREESSEVIKKELQQEQKANKLFLPLLF